MVESQCFRCIIKPWFFGTGYLEIFKLVDFRHERRGNEDANLHWIEVSWPWYGLNEKNTFRDESSSSPNPKNVKSFLYDVEIIPVRRRNHPKNIKSCENFNTRPFQIFWTKIRFRELRKFRWDPMLPKCDFQSASFHSGSHIPTYLIIDKTVMKGIRLRNNSSYHYIWHHQSKKEERLFVVFLHAMCFDYIISQEAFYYLPWRNDWGLNTSDTYLLMMMREKQ